MAISLVRRALRRVPRNGLLVLAYHNVVSSPAHAGADVSLHLPVGEFRSHLAILAEEAEVVPLTDETTASSRPRVAITFDDAYFGAVRNALPLLAERGWPATVFVSPGRLGGESFWWDCIRYDDAVGTAESFRNAALELYGGRDGAVRRFAVGVGLALDEPAAESRTAALGDLVTALGANQNLTLGAHTWSHVCLPTIAPTEAEDEVRRSIEWLSAFGERGLPFLAYPYGAHSKDVERISEAAGAVRAFRVSGGWSTASRQRGFSWPRANVPAGLSPAGLLLRLYGVVTAS